MPWSSLCTDRGQGVAAARRGRAITTDGYVISFMCFHERVFATPTHRFLRGLLHYYKIELQLLNPNGIQHMVAFVALCEGLLGISPHFDLCRYFFIVSLQRKREKGGRQELHMPMGRASIQLWNN